MAIFLFAARDGAEKIVQNRTGTALSNSGSDMTEKKKSGEKNNIHKIGFNIVRCAF